MGFVGKAIAAVVVALGACIAGATPARADSIAMDPSGIAATGSGDFTLGWRFTANSDIVVTSLGYYDYGGDGFAGSHDVAIYTLGGTLLGSATVTSSDTLIDDFRYVTLTTGISLTAGTDYVIGGANDSGDVYIASSSFTTASEVSFVQGRFVSGGTLAFPTSVDNTGAASIFGPNFQFAPVPEPTSLALLALGLGGIVARRRRKTGASA